ncbi:MAG: adenosylcobinamide-GDP ribazoletransferase [Eubacteriales bacterium]|nr:adenosylcobinamide-GDP ribazoletransferase [Eubacteriales bacterium]
MRLIRSFIVAFSMFSRVPMPHFEWKDEDMKYMLCFFPWVGAVIGVCIYLWRMLATALEINNLCYTAIGVAIPIIITGGFHIDGFMDTSDALHSFRDREKKLEILKDSHIGAFSVIRLALYGLIFMGAFSVVERPALLAIVCAGFFFARCISGLGVIILPKARDNGLLYNSARTAEEKTVRTVLIIEAVLCAAFMLWQSAVNGAIIIAAAVCSFLLYYRRCKKEFGGTTGDTAGYFLLICEETIVVVAAILGFLRMG